MIEIKNIEHELLKIGGKPNLKGFSYCITAIQIYDNQKSMTKEIYPNIAEQFSTTSNRVERAIRHFRLNLRNSEYENYTNSEFIATMQYKIKEIYNEH